MATLAAGPSTIQLRLSTGNAIAGTPAQLLTLLSENTPVWNAAQGNNDFQIATQATLAAFLVDASANLIIMNSVLTCNENITLATLKTVDGRDLSVDGAKLDLIEALADVTDTANVTAAGALMDSEVDADLKTFVLPASTTISTFGASLVDDAAASNARTTLGLVIGTDVQADLDVVGQTEAETGTATTERIWTAERVKQAIAALASGLTLGTKQASTSGTAIDFTSLPAGIKRIMISFQSVSLSGTDDLLIQLGDSVGFEATGYVSSSGVILNGATSTVVSSTTGFIAALTLAGAIYNGILVLTRMDASHLWCSSHSGAVSGTRTNDGGGQKTISDELTQVRITRTGTNTFDAGAINIMYEL